MTAGTRPSYLQDMADVERRLRDVERATARIPARLGGGGGASDFTLLIVGAGNTLFSAAYDLKGLKYSATAITSLPSSVPASLTVATSDGLTAAQISGTSTLVWLASRVDPGGGAPVAFDALITIPEGQLVACRRTSAIGGVTIYLPWRA